MCYAQSVQPFVQTIMKTGGYPYVDTDLGYYHRFPLAPAFQKQCIPWKPFHPRWSIPVQYKI